MRTLALPDWHESQGPADFRFELISQEGRCALRLDGREIHAGDELAEALAVMRGPLHLEVARRSPSGVFVHAGLVAWAGCGIVLPGPSGVGKTSLVQALVEAGCEFYSDEYAIVGADGRMHSYPMPIMRRRTQGGLDFLPAEALGWGPQRPAIPLAAVVQTEFQRDSQWQPIRLSLGEGILRLFENTVCARTDSARALEWLRAAAQGATCLSGRRGEAQDCAQDILDWLKTTT